MTIRPGRVVWRAVGRAAVQPTALCAGGAMAVVATALHSGTLFALGLAAYAASAALALVRRGFWRNVVEAMRREGPSLPVYVDSWDPGARVLLSRLTNARFARQEASEQLPPASPVRAAAAERAAELEEMAVQLVRAGARLGEHLSPDTRGPLRDHVRWLSERAEAAAPDARAEYQRAMTALQQKLTGIEELERKRQLIVARLEAVVCTLEALGEDLLESPLRAAADHALADDFPLMRALDEMSPVELASESGAGAARGLQERGA